MTNIDRYKIEAEQDWHGWIDKIPAIQFDAGLVRHTQRRNK